MRKQVHEGSGFSDTMQLVSVISPFFLCSDFPGISWLWLFRGFGKWEMHPKKMPHETGVLAHSWLQSLLENTAKAWRREEKQTHQNIVSFLYPMNEAWKGSAIPRSWGKLQPFPVCPLREGQSTGEWVFSLILEVWRIIFEHQFLIVSWLSIQRGCFSFRTLLGLGRLGRTQLEMGKGEEDRFGLSQYNPNTS